MEFKNLKEIPDGIYRVLKDIDYFIDQINVPIIDKMKYQYLSVRTSDIEFYIRWSGISCSIYVHPEDEQYVKAFLLTINYSKQGEK